MIRVVVTVFLIASTLSFSSSRAEAKARYTLKPPQGWVLDTQSGRSQGLHVVLYPESSSWAKGNVVMYSNSVDKKRLGPKADVHKVMDLDIESFRKRSPEIKVGPVQRLTTKKGKPVLLREFSGDAQGNYEAVAYIEEESSVIVMALSARNKSEYSKSLEPFRELVTSYALLDSGYVQTLEGVQKALELAPLRRAKEDKQKPGGPRYESRLGARFGKVHRDHVVSCIKATRSLEYEPIDFVLKVGPKGKTDEIYTFQKSKIAQCLKSKLATERWPEPPFTPFHAHVKLRLK